jgi:hypothetical protein
MNARAVTALVLAMLSLSLVFAAGRISAWIVPVTDTPHAVADTQEKQERMKEPGVPAAKTAFAAKPRAAPSSPGVIEAAIGDAKTSADPTTPSVASSGETSGAVALMVAERVLRGTEVAAQQAPADQNVVSTAPTAPKAPVERLLHAVVGVAVATVAAA